MDSWGNLDIHTAIARDDMTSSFRHKKRTVSN